MYSQAAIELYGELLKTAASTLDANGVTGDGLFKEAGLWNRLKSVVGRGAKAAVPAAESEASRAMRSAALDYAYGPAMHQAANEYAYGARGLAGPKKPMGAGGKMLLGAGAVGAAGGAYGLGRHLQANKDKTNRNLAFGAGAAAGLAAPSVLRGISNTASNLAANPTSLLGGGMNGY